MDKETALYAVMLSELPHVGDQAADAFCAVNRERGHGLAHVLSIAGSGAARGLRLAPRGYPPLCAERSEHEQRCRWLLDQFAAAGGGVALADDAAIPRACGNG